MVISFPKSADGPALQAALTDVALLNAFSRLRLAVHLLVNSLQIPLLSVNLFLIFLNNNSAWG